MKGRTKAAVVIGVVLVLVAAYDALQQAKAAAQAYIYGYPLVVMELTRKALVADSHHNGFTHGRRFPDHTFRHVVRPNNDTLYSIAWLDLSEDAVVLTVPDTQGRYYVMPLMDAWTNVFATVGKRSYGTAAGSYLIIGPNWEGEVPRELITIKSPTKMVWLIGRIQTNGPSDVQNVARLQEQFALAQLQQWGSGVSIPHKIQDIAASDAGKDPYQEIADMTGVEFFSLFATLLTTQSPAPADSEMLATIADIGLVPGEPFSVGPWSGWLLDKAKHFTHQGVIRQLEKQPATENGWSVRRNLIGVYGTHYGVRTGVAMVGLGALPPEEAVYPNTKVDESGQALTGSQAYKLHFPAGGTPPSQAFWSITVYDEQGFLVENSIDRYALGDRDPLAYNPDGSLDIAIQHNAPAGAGANWLPVPSGPFTLTMRIYLPDQSFLQGNWRLPPVERVN